MLIDHETRYRGAMNLALQSLPCEWSRMALNSREN
jgi:hypothetical protein